MTGNLKCPLFRLSTMNAQQLLLGLCLTVVFWASASDVENVIFSVTTEVLDGGLVFQLTTTFLRTNQSSATSNIRTREAHELIIASQTLTILFSHE